MNQNDLAELTIEQLGQLLRELTERNARDSYAQVKQVVDEIFRRAQAQA